MTSRRATLAQVVADSLRASIRAGRYACGERLIELAIAQSQNVSQNTVRDALRQLETEGWVRYEARRGVRVRRFDAAEAEEVFALLATIEPLALGWAFEAHTADEVAAALSQPIRRAVMAHNVGQIEQRRDALFAFHAALAALSGRQQTQRLLSRLHNKAYLLTADFETREPSYTHHGDQIDGYEELHALLQSGTPADAQAALAARLLADGKPIVRWLALRG